MLNLNLDIGYLIILLIYDNDVRVLLPAPHCETALGRFAVHRGKLLQGP